MITSGAGPEEPADHNHKEFLVRHAILAICLAVFLAGCGGYRAQPLTQLARGVVEQCLSAAKAKDLAKIEKALEVAKRHRENKKMTSDELSVVEGMYNLGKSGSWEAAEKLAKDSIEYMKNS
jgi:hypothetical protein